MKIDFMPKTRLGKWAVGIGIALVFLSALELVFAFAVGGDPTVVAGSPILSILGAVLSIAFTLAGPTSFIVGVIAIIKHKEWLVCKILVVLYFLTILLFILGESFFAR